MQEELENRTIAVSVQTSKLTAQTLATALQAVARQIQQAHKNAQTPHGRQSMKKLMNHGVNTNSIPLDGSTRLFDRIARKYHVDYHFHKTGPKKYLLFFKAGQADAITACFSEYAKRAMSRGRQPSYRQQLDRAAELVRARPRERERTREAAHDDR